MSAPPDTGPPGVERPAAPSVLVAEKLTRRLEGEVPVTLV
jgi:hypothetical protein